MLFAIIFLIAFIVIAAFALYLSRTIEHGEARFDTRSRVIADPEARKDATIRPARRIEDTETTEGER